MVVGGEMGINTSSMAKLDLLVGPLGTKSREDELNILVGAH